MAHTKILEDKTNWLDHIDGMTVADAVKYLMTLPPTHKLDYHMEGDTHGCSVESCLTYEVPKTNAEIYADIEKHYLKQIAIHEDAKARHLVYNRQERIAMCDQQIAQFKTRLEEAKIKYC